ncbi:GTP-binding protein YPT6 [Tritrichomonas foetus]|uniref:GTP-binding protein YPT6 n=1 Tax=Tritrichomonas foetus TaxID=1144522 RepID=A0A1J4J9N3_9EUKA|nr:GTP-binding protein YPT6 [Tritrichomonas foetus]|eukprot:OHS95377.1 GTP-binding protein YPT6 [Tritrichomonas foetus]
MTLTSHKIIFLGSTNVGKTSIISRMTSDIFEESIQNTIGIDHSTKIISVDDIEIALDIWDTAGQERFKSIATTYSRNAQVVCITFALDSQKSFDELNEWYQMIMDQTTQPPKFIVIGNKSDLSDSIVVQEKTAQNFAKAIKSDYIQVSAKTGENIKELLSCIGHACLQSEEETQSDNNKGRDLTQNENQNKGCC